MENAHYRQKLPSSVDHFFVVTCTGGFLALAAVAVFLITSYFY